MKQRLVLTYEARNSQARCIGRWRGPARSFLKAYIQAVHSLLNHTVQAIFDTDNVSRNYNPAVAARHLLIAAPATITTYGSRIGSGDNPVALSNYALQTPYLDTVAGGPFSHTAMSFLTDFTTAARMYTRWQRTMTNNSGANKTVAESALYFLARDDVLTDRYFCAVRDILSAPQVIPHLGSITITYELYIEP